MDRRQSALVLFVAVSGPAVAPSGFVTAFTPPSVAFPMAMRTTCSAGHPPLADMRAAPLASSRADDALSDPSPNGINEVSPADDPRESDSSPSKPSSWLPDIWGDGALFRKPPPFIVDDTNLLFYDVALLLNLSLSISFWVVHRMSFFHMGSALSEGSLLCIAWILAGLYNGAFLYSAVDGHREGEDGGPKAAGLLGLSTFVGACNLRITVALAQAVWDHRPVGITDGEKLIPLEIVTGLVLMSLWRALHSYYTPRI